LLLAILGSFARFEPPLESSEQIYPPSAKLAKSNAQIATCALIAPCAPNRIAGVDQSR